MPSTKTAASSALGAALVLAVMLAITIRTGVSQQHFEAPLPVADYTRDLLTMAGPLRAILTLDALFIALYTAMALMVAELLTTAQNRVLTRLCSVAVTVAAALDLLENHHIAVLLSMAEAGLPIAQSELSAQAVASMFKWHLGYLAFFLLGCAMEPRTRSQTLLRFTLLFVQLPVGALFYTVPPALSPVFLWLRYLNLLTGFLVFGLALFRERPQGAAFGESGSASRA